MSASPASDQPLKRTPLYAQHVALGAKMVPFAGYEMPVQYPLGILKEHLHTRAQAGLFDVSHMGQAFLAGPDHATTAAALEALVPADILGLEPGQQRYTQLLTDDGGIIDDLMVTRPLARDEDGRLYLVVNASRKEVDYAHLAGRLPVSVKLVPAPELALIALQGPAASRVMAGLSPAAAAFAFMTGAPARIGSFGCHVSRSGYTGEDGFEIFMPPEAADGIFRRLLEAGKEKGLVPAGLGARDTLRLEARMCLYGNDMDESTTLVEAGLGWIVSLEDVKGDFVGRPVLEPQKKNGAPRKLVGFEVLGRGIARHGYPVYLDDDPSGSVTSGTYAPFLQKNIGLCYLPTARATVGTEFEVDVRGRRVKAKVVPTPFYKRAR
jgi:aminomethyltransferase